MPMGLIKYLKIFCFIVTHFNTNFFILHPIEKHVWNLFTTLYICIYYIQLMNLMKMGRETIYMEEYTTVHGLLSWSSVLLNLYCSNKYSSIFTHLIKHLINAFFQFQVKTSDQNKHAYIKINLPNSLLVWVY